MGMMPPRQRLWAHGLNVPAVKEPMVKLTKAAKPLRAHLLDETMLADIRDLAAANIVLV
jgi:hypothetical protein